MKKKVILVVSILLILVLGVGLFFRFSNSDTAVKARLMYQYHLPKDAANLAVTYWDALREGPEAAGEYIHFEHNDYMREAFLNSGNPLLEYRVDHAEKINDRLYAITVEVMDEVYTLLGNPGFHKVYNFVVNIDGEWKYLNSVLEVPADAQQNLDLSKYEYPYDVDHMNPYEDEAYLALER